LNRDTAQRFRRLRGAHVEQFGDQATRWVTLNEPLVLGILGYYEGRFAPGSSRLRRGVHRRAPICCLRTDRARCDASASPAAEIGSRATSRTLRPPATVTKAAAARRHGGEPAVPRSGVPRPYPDDALS